jgi:hypothetical protein
MNQPKSPLGPKGRIPTAGIKPGIKPGVRPVANTTQSTPAPSMGPPPWYKKKYLVYPKFQMTLILLNSVVTLILFILTSLLVVRSNLFLENVVRQAKLPAQDVFIQILDQQLKSLMGYMAVTVFIAVTVTGLLTLLISHKLAGPMIKLRRYFGDIEKSGNITEDLYFRGSDFFQDLPPTINRALKALKKK